MQLDPVNDQQQILEMITDPSTEWGKVTGYGLSTKRWKDMPVPLGKTIWRLMDGRGWHRTEFREILLNDPEFNPVPYKVTYVL